MDYFSSVLLRAAKGVRNLITSSDKTMPLKEGKAGTVTEVHGPKAIAELAEKAHRLRLVTDFDRILNYVKDHGRAGYPEISSALGVPLQRVDECCTILEEEKEIEIIYPPIGHPIAQAIGYVQQEKQVKTWLPRFPPRQDMKEGKAQG